MSQINSYQLLLNKLDAFIRKYYLNQIIRGSLFSLALIGGLFLLFSLAEYYFFFPPNVRKVFFYSFLAASITGLTRWVVLPAFKYFRLGTVLSHTDAATIIGKHFHNVSDKLLNILQLKDQSRTASDIALIEASINQKSDEIKLVPFPSAINLSTNRQYLKYALPPLMIIFALLLMAPSIITDSTGRIIRNNEEFAPAAPFAFVITNPTLSVPQYENFNLEVKTEGSANPTEVFIDIEGTLYRMSQMTPGRFSYTFNTVQSDIQFQLSSGRVKSSWNDLKVLLKPQLVNFTTQLDFPAYTGYKDQIKENIGDLTVPEGTRLNWTFDTEHTDQVQLRWGNEDVRTLDKNGLSSYSFSTQVRSASPYTTIVKNLTSAQTDSVQYFLSVIRDQFPTIAAQTFRDSSSENTLFFAGETSDDYGLKKLSFHYRVTRHQQEAGNWTKEDLPLLPKKALSFQHSLSLDSIKMAPGDKVEFFFEVWDNDGVNGSKSSRTYTDKIEMATPEELKAESEQNSKEIKEKLQDNIQKARDIQKELEKLREKLLNSKKPEWEDKKKLEELIQQQQQLKEQFQQAQQQLEQNMKNQDQLQQNQEEIREKQEKLKELFDEVVDKDMQELMEEIQKLMEELNKENPIQEMKNMEMSEQELEKEMDRLLELYKQLELEKDLQNQIEKLQELAEKQEELSEKTKNPEANQEELKKEQEEINKEFDDVQKKQEEIQEKNQELEKPKDIDDQKEEMEDIDQDMNDAQEQLEKQENQGASKSQKSASDKMKQMASDMQSSMEQEQQQQQAEDIQTLRQLLENLVSLSFDQEELEQNVARTNPATPRYVELTQHQFKLEDDFSLIQDSLESLAKRNLQIESYILDKTNEITGLFTTTLDDLEERNKNRASEGQRKIMKNTNDLALMLSESLSQMQQQMASMMKGNQMCNKPGGANGKSGKVPMDKITQGQEKLGDQLEKMKEGMKDGKSGKPGMSKEFAQAAARQAAMRKALQELQKEKQEQGQGSEDLQKIIDEMDKMEVDLLNKRLDNQLLKRQANIETRLLEAEKAERQREWDDQRKSTTAQEVERKLPPSLEKYLKEREAEIDLYQKVSPELRPYYKSLVEEYYKSLK